MSTPKGKSHSVFSSRVKLTFRAGGSDSETDQIMRALIATLNLQQSMGNCADWIKQAMLERLLRDRARMEGGSGSALMTALAGQAVESSDAGTGAEVSAETESSSAPVKRQPATAGHTSARKSVEQDKRSNHGDEAWELPKDEVMPATPPQNRARVEPANKGAGSPTPIGGEPAPMPKAIASLF